jgi:hypothetical protein
MTSPQLEDLPDFLKPKLRLFMSVDIAGSTQFKQHLLSHKNAVGNKEDPESSNPSEPWLSPILEFYEQISVIFNARWSAITDSARAQLPGCEFGERPNIWKAVGDELVFTKILQDHRQAYACIAAWLETIQTYRKRVKELGAGLDLKASAWIAGFPVNNAEVILNHQGEDAVLCDDGDYIYGNLSRLESHHANAGGIRDFIGPSIDTGFRIASVATPRKFVLSPDLAFLLAHAAVNLQTCWTSQKLEFYYEGRKSFKGVANGAPFPVFWVNTLEPDPLIKIEDKIQNLTSISASEVKEFCELFLERNRETHLMHPFIPSDADVLFKNIPSRHVDKLQKLAQYWITESARRRVEQSAQLEPEEATTTDSEAQSADLEALSAQLTNEISSTQKL